MEMLTKAGSLKLEYLPDVTRVSKENCKQLVQAIGKVVDMNLWASCKVDSISHHTALKTVVDNTISLVSTATGETAKETLKATDEPKELKFFSYDQLKRQAVEMEGVYRGKLYGTIMSNACPQEMNCTSCGGSGICKACEGNKQVTCTVCFGSTSCQSCDGSGTYTCENCNGSGECPECDDGWIECDDCWGSGEVACWDCNGTGIYSDNHHPGGVTCRSCGGSGRHRCSNCHGKGGWNCEECNGSGECSHCKGEGGFPCKACGATGKCGKCRGRGKIWCPECHGKGMCFDCKGEKLVVCTRCQGSGVYQSYTEYTFEEETTHKSFFTYPVPEDCVDELLGKQVYKDVLYKFFAGQVEIFDLDNAVSSLNGNHSKDFMEWVRIEGLSRFLKDKLNNDYLFTQVENVLVPVVHVKLLCRKQPYNIYIMGRNKVILYDSLPSTLHRFFGRFFNR